MTHIKLLFIALFLSFAAFSQTQTITGNIYDEASKGPLTGVVIAVLNTDKGAVTDSNGHFKIEKVEIGRRTFKISYMSYEDKMLNDIEVTAGKEVNLNIYLQEAVHTLKEVTVVYNKSKDKNNTINDMAMVSARSFNIDETNKYAGSLNDPSRMAANFAGIVAGNDSRNDIVVRGNSPTGMLWDIEGLSTPNPNHFGSLNSTGGPVSMLNNNNIDKSDFITGAFPAQYGNALAGVFDIRLRDGNKDKPEYVAQIGFNGFEGGAEGPIGKAGQTSYLINYRYSTLGVFAAMGLNLGTGKSVPLYQDANYKLVSKLNKKTKITLFGIVGESSVDFLGKDVDTTKPNLYSNSDPYQNQHTLYATTITGITLEHQISDKSSTKLILGYCTTYEQYSSDSISKVNGVTYQNQTALFKTGQASALWSYLHKFNAKNNIQAGVSYTNTGFDLLNKTMSPGMPDNVYVNQTGNMGLEQAYTQWKHRFNKDFSFVAGVHAQYLDLNGSFAVEPRASIRYAINSRNAVSLGTGIHNQVQSIYSYFVETPTSNGVIYTNKNLNFTRSQHIVASYDLNVTPNMRIKVETYYQNLSNVPVNIYSSSYSALNYGATFAPPNQDSLTNKGTGYNYGAELTIEHFLSKGFYFLITGSLIDSRYKGSDGIERNTAFNTGYVFNVLGGKEFKVGKKGNKLAINLKTSVIGGRYLTPIDLIASQNAGTEIEYNNLAYSVKQADYFRVDLKLSYKKEFKKSTLEYSLDLENVTAHDNIFNQSYEANTKRIITNYQQGFFPVPFFRYTF